MLVCVVLSCLFLAALWSPAGKGLTSWLSRVLCFLMFCHFPKCVLVNIRIKGEVGAVKLVSGGSKAVLLLWICFVNLCFVFVLLSCLFIAALWSPAGKGLTLALLNVMFYCNFVTFRCGVLGQLYRFLIFASLLTLNKCTVLWIGTLTGGP